MREKLNDTLVLFNPAEYTSVMLEFTKDLEIKAGDRIILVNFPDYTTLFIERKEINGEENR